jgi:hypothetical protein
MDEGLLRDLINQLHNIQLQMETSTNILIEIEAMKAENAKRKSRGLGPAYGEEEFEQLKR